MVLSFPHIWGSGGGSGYVEDGLFFQEENNYNFTTKTETFDPNITLTECTIEVCYSATAIAQTVGRLLVFAYEYLQLNKDLATGNSDYGLQVFYGFEYDNTALVRIDNLVFGNDIHTFTVTQSGTRTNVYFDGALVGGFDNANGRTTISDNAVFFNQQTYPLTCKFFNTRSYNRALTAAEIAANCAEDMRRYG